MVSYLLVLLALQPICFMPLYCIHRILPMKHPCLYIGLTLGTMDLLWVVNRLILPSPIKLLNFLMLFAGFFYLIFFAEKKQKLLSLFTWSILVCLCFVILNLAGHGIMALAPILGISLSRTITIQDPVYLIRTLICGAILLPVLYVLTRVLADQRSNVFETRQLLWFLTIPFSQAVLLLLIHDNLEYADTVQAWATILSCGLLCISADFACIVGYRKIIRLQLIADQVQQAEDQLKVQNEYYREMQDNILKVNRIRHDLNNQLKTAYYLLEQGHPEEVRAQLDSLKSCVQDHIGTKYCENLMVDAVLREKAGLCEKLGIPLELSVLIPADLKIESAHLCSAFSNLLDNCIAAARKAGSDSGPITLRSDILKGYLTIACSNPSVPPSSERETDILRRHGLGLEILDRLATLHHGSLEAYFRDGRFYVAMLLKNE